VPGLPEVSGVFDSYSYLSIGYLLEARIYNRGLRSNSSLVGWLTVK